jgi:hypothetical protein
MTKSLCLFAAVHTAILAAAAPVLSKVPTAAIAKACREREIKAFPRVSPGIYGHATAQREYFQNCLSEMQREREEPGVLPPGV